MASAIPSAIGVGSSIIGGISGKGARKAQEKLAKQQLQQLQPLINAQIAASVFGLDKARQLFPEAESMFSEVFDKSRQSFDTGMTDYRRLLDEGLAESGALANKSSGYLQGAGNALQDILKFYTDVTSDPRSAIDRFLPTKARTEEVLAPEFGNINVGYDAARSNASNFGPRGGKAAALMNLDLMRQRDLSDLFFKGRQGLATANRDTAFQGAAGKGQAAQGLAGLGLGIGNLSLDTLRTKGGLAQNSFGQGLQALGIGGNAAQGKSNLALGGLGVGSSGAQGPMNLYNNQANRAYGGSPSSSGSGSQLGGFLVDLFNNKGVQDKLGGIFGGGKDKSLFLTDPFANQNKDFDFFA